MCFLVGIVAPTVAEADDHAFHAVGFRFGPVDVALPFGNVDHAFGLLHEQVVLVVEEGFRIVVSAPVRAVFIAFEFGELYVRVGYSIFDIFRTYRNEGFAVGFGERIRLLILRTDQCRIGHGFAGFNILDLTFGGNGRSSETTVASSEISSLTVLEVSHSDCQACCLATAGRPTDRQTAQQRHYLQ